MPRALVRDRAATDLSSRSTADLTRSYLGRSLNHAQLDELLCEIELSGADLAAAQQRRTVWVGSVGYENFRHVHDFAAHLSRQGVQRLIDVRELPISRRRGYAKTALSAALAEEDIEYLHVRGLGNPKPIRDLYKSGGVKEGRERYERHLLGEHRDELDRLALALEDKRSASCAWSMISPPVTAM